MTRPSQTMDAPHLADLIADLVDLHPEGIGMEGLMHAFGDMTTRRTLQRRLAELLARGRIRAHGRSRALKYRPAPAALRPVSATDAAARPEGGRPSVES